MAEKNILTAVLVGKMRPLGFATWALCRGLENREYLIGSIQGYSYVLTYSTLLLQIFPVCLCLSACLPVYVRTNTARKPNNSSFSSLLPTHLHICTRKTHKFLLVLRWKFFRLGFFGSSLMPVFLCFPSPSPSGRNEAGQLLEILGKGKSCWPVQKRDHHLQQGIPVKLLVVGAERQGACWLQPSERLLTQSEELWGIVCDEFSHTRIVCAVCLHHKSRKLGRCRV